MGFFKKDPRSWEEKSTDAYDAAKARNANRGEPAGSKVKVNGGKRQGNSRRELRNHKKAMGDWHR